MATNNTKIAIIGSGFIGISTAYYLCLKHNLSNVFLIDIGNPMSFTSSQSGENYRNWWPHPSMVDLMNRSIDLLENLVEITGNRKNISRRGYVLSTRESNIRDLIDQLRFGLGSKSSSLIRYHKKFNKNNYYVIQIMIFWTNLTVSMCYKTRSLFKPTSPLSLKI